MPDFVTLASCFKTWILLIFYLSWRSNFQNPQNPLLIWMLCQPRWWVESFLIDICTETLLDFYQIISEGTQGRGLQFSKLYTPTCDCSNLLWRFKSCLYHFFGNKKNIVHTWKMTIKIQRKNNCWKQRVNWQWRD